MAGTRFILFRWLARNYLTWLVIFLGLLAGLIWLFEVAELLRRAAEKPEATWDIVLTMATLKLPETLERVLPFVILFSAFFSLSSLTRSRELIVARATGISVWQFLGPALIVTVLVSVISVGLFNPLSALLITRYRGLEAHYLKRTTSLELTGAGLWLRQNYGATRYLLHADRVTHRPLTLSPVTVLISDDHNRYLERIDAPRAVLTQGFWYMPDALRHQEGHAPERTTDLRLPTHLTYATIQESMASPDSIGFWHLPDFMATLEAIGLPTERHALKFQRLLATPLLLGAMVLFAAIFALKPTSRRGGGLKMGIASILCGVSIFAMNNILVTLGTNQSLPLFIAAWTTPLLATFAGTWALLHAEDG